MIRKCNYDYNFGIAKLESKLSNCMVMKILEDI